MRFRQLTCVALVAGFFAGSAQWVQAYYDDTHYSFTYYMARQCGYTPLQSHRMASANVSVDYSLATEPVRLGVSVADALLQPSLAVAAVIGPSQTPLSAAAQQPRVDFHAMRNALKFGRGDEAKADQAIQEQERILWQAAISLQNPGILLHFIQDEPAHAGYASFAGHWVPNARIDVASLGALDPLADPSLPMGATTDFLSYRPDKTNLMVAKTVAALLQFRLAMSPRQRPGNCTPAAMQSVKDRLSRANFVTPTAEQYAGRVRTNDSSPDMVRADSVVSNALSSDVTQYPTQRKDVKYTASGMPLNASPEDFTLYGTVTTRLRRAGPPQGPVEVSIWAKPTRRDEPLHQLNCTSVAGPGLDGGPILPGILDKLPVGELLVRAVTSSGKVIEKSVTLDQLDLEVYLDIPAAPEKKSSCGNQVAEAASQMCKATGRFSKPSTRFDEEFQKDVKEAEDCEEKEEEKEKEKAKQTETTNTTPTNTPPPTSSGPSIGKILGWTTVLVGGVVGGAYVYEQAQLLAEETGSTNTNTTTTTNNPTPTSNTPSTVGLGGFSCTAANATSNFRTCTGSINVRAGTALGARAGSSIGVQTTPSFFVGTMTAPSVGGTTGTVSLRATLASCPTQTSVNFAPVGGQPFESVSVSIPVSCP